MRIHSELVAAALIGIIVCYLFFLIVQPEPGTIRDYQILIGCAGAIAAASIAHSAATSKTRLDEKIDARDREEKNRNLLLKLQYASQALVSLARNNLRALARIEDSGEAFVHNMFSFAIPETPELLDGWNNLLAMPETALDPFRRCTWSIKDLNMMISDLEKWFCEDKFGRFSVYGVALRLERVVESAENLYCVLADHNQAVPAGTTASERAVLFQLEVAENGPLPTSENMKSKSGAEAFQDA